MTYHFLSLEVCTFRRACYLNRSLSMIKYSLFKVLEHSLSAVSCIDLVYFLERA